MNNSRTTEITRIVLYAMSIFLIVILAILSCQKILDFKYDTQSDEVMLNAIIVSVQILIMVGNAIFNRQVDSVYFGRKNKKNRINKLKSKVYSDVEYARQELRMGLNTIFVLAVLIIVVLMVTTGRIYLSVAAGIIITIAYIYADYIPHAKFYAEKYDRIFCKEKPRAKRGLARIYYNEYKNTKFDDRSPLYKDINTLQEVQLEDLNREYMYCYLWSHLADKKDKSMISFFALFVVNIFTLNPSFYYEITKSLGLRNDVFSAALIVINMLASVTFALLIFAQLPDYDREQDEILMDILSSEDTDEKLLNRYNSLIHENRSQLIQARARFDYTMLKIDDGVTLSEDDLKYQMLFVHKRVPNLQRYNNTVILCAVSVELLIMEFIGMSNYLIAPALTGIVLLLSGKLIVRNIGKRSISRECEMLETEKQEERNLE